MQPVIDVSKLPTPIALVANRLNVAGHCPSAETFLCASYLFEAFLKSVVVVWYSALNAKNSDTSYRIAFNVLRADGLGVWADSLREMAALSASSLPREFFPLVSWATKKLTKPEDQWGRDSFTAAQVVLRQLGTDGEMPEKLNVGHIISSLIQIRNKTKAHGAVGDDFYLAANASYVDSIVKLLGSCPALKWTWLRANTKSGAAKKVVLLTGTSPRRATEAETELFINAISDGVSFIPENSRQPVHASILLDADLDCKSFRFPNGGIVKDRAEFLDYSSGTLHMRDVSAFLTPPAMLPPSETHSDFIFDVQSNAFGNLPLLPDRFVQRPALQETLQTRLRDRNHSIITLHGRGGVGKTYLALHAAHDLIQASEPLFEDVIWLSARDIDLRMSGPAHVRQDVKSLEEICRALGQLFRVDGSLDSVTSILQDPTSATECHKGFLLILDNFETLASGVEIHKFLDTHTHLPNKVLITSRERAFKADFPIEVLGMELDEARILLRRTAEELGITHLIDEERIKELHEYTDGHAYAMRVIVGEMAKEGKNVALKNVLAKRKDVIDAVFERSFSKLKDAGRRIFLTVGGLQSVVSELALLVVLGQHDLDVEAGIDECVRLSLLDELELADGSPCFHAPQLARLFAQKKLDGDPDRLLVHEDLQSIREFGLVPRRQRLGNQQDDAVKSFIGYCLSRPTNSAYDSDNRVRKMLENLAELWPSAWLSLYEYLERHGA
ncbi:MAG: hypothetical protein IAG10_34170, partial [Planctomycetaceae bacterium]|nr:hypothetical protein [Planctomycetaceae bacterium]